MKVKAINKDEIVYFSCKKMHTNIENDVETSKTDGGSKLPDKQNYLSPPCW